ncbi:MAG: RES family NAD+ phosphorylase [Pseudomonas kermanshahensis]|uniref:RES family NAD+ phosphorylase n=1 Tax=Pseudomonas kermanshahensis TaxID=2745482 RepID=UPI003D113634
MVVVTLEEVIEVCRESVLSSFEVVEQPPSVYLYNRNPIGEHWTDVLHRVLGCSDELITDIGEALWEGWSDGDPHFTEGISASTDMTYEWREMERSLCDEARFVNPTVMRVLEQVFGTVDQLHLRDSESAIFVIGPGQPLRTFKRARVFSSDHSVEEALLHPERSLGPPPPGVGAAGRMNAKGVSVFYGATNDRTAIAEVRPPVGSYVVTAAFEVTRPLRLLNLAGLNEIRPDTRLSYFDPDRVEQAKRCAFLASLQKQLLKPVMPELADQGYLITQAIADFLSTHPTLNLDGIYFPSIQGKRPPNSPCVS